MQSCEEGAEDEHDHDNRSPCVDGGVGRPRRGARGGARAVRQGWWCVATHDGETAKSLALATPFLLRPELGACLQRSFWKKGQKHPAAPAARGRGRMAWPAWPAPQTEGQSQSERQMIGSGRAGLGTVG